MDFLEEKKRKIAERIHSLLKDSSYPSELQEAALYAVQSGKKLRPLMVLLTVESLGGSWEKALDAACALEFIHSYSLIHDDLPCMDDDDFRRGKPTVHKVFGEAVALLAGDLLLTYAFEVLAKAEHSTDQEKSALVRILARKAGGKGMIGGQAEDLAAEGKEISLRKLYSLQYRKTALLIMTAFEFGAILAAASKKEQKTLSEFGKRLGIAYQVADDLLDASLPPEQNSDLVKKKATAFSILGKDKAEKALKALHRSALSKLSRLSKPAPLLKNLTSLLLERNC
jgi:geranylgeranyl diphosphate synthase, type II